MLRDPLLRQYSAVVVDEVHERSVNVDLILGFLRQLVTNPERGASLKIVVMSATADMGALLKFFQDGLVNQPKANGSIQNGDVEGGLEWSGFSGEEELEEEDPHDSKYISICRIEGRQYPVKVNYAPDPVHDFVDAALQAIFKIHYKEAIPGDILVFLTGQETVESLEKLVNDYAEALTPEIPRLLVLPLFAALPQVAQQRVFQPTPPRTRKVILSTNIAETSVTVSGVRFVIDCGKSKIKQFFFFILLVSFIVKQFF